MLMRRAGPDTSSFRYQSSRTLHDIKHCLQQRTFGIRKRLQDRKMISLIDGEETHWNTTLTTSAAVVDGLPSQFWKLAHPIGDHQFRGRRGQME
jgi:hypothetical protein